MPPYFPPEALYTSKFNFWLIIPQLTHAQNPRYKHIVFLFYAYLLSHISDINNMEVMTIWAFLFHWFLDSIM